MSRSSACAAAVVSALGIGLTVASGQTPPPGITRTVLVENVSVLVARLRLAPGAREEPHTHPFSAVVVQIDPGQVDMLLGEKRATERRALGFTEFIPREVRHAAANVGSAAFDVVTVAIKPDRTPAASAPVTEPPPGITRQVILDNLETRVTKVTFAASAKEPMHTHPFDLVVVQLTAGRMDVQNGDARGTKAYAPGEVVFVPRNVSHAFASTEERPIDLMSVTIK
jgi:quercetin dioxygenase-like cupin family protein